MEKHKKTFIKLFGETARYVHRYQLFGDFIDCAAAAIHNRFVHDDDLERSYLDCVKRYKREDMEKMSRLLAELVMGLESGFCDFLGEVFMELELGNQARGQIFTPYHISKLCALMTHGNSFPQLDTVPFITVNDCCCGAGAMIIAFAESMLESGFNPQERMWAHCTDIDDRCAKMAYIQLALFGLPAEIVIGDSLRMDFRKVLRTPAHYLLGWDAKLRQRYTQVAHEPTVSKAAEQLTLFDLELAS